MSLYSPSIEKLIESFERLPSIGHKTAARLAFYILNCSEEETNEFIGAITNAKKNLKYCNKCFNISDTDPCTICGNPKRDQSIICVVEDVRDIVAMEKTHEFKGVYHVLHGSISPMNGVGPDDIKIKEYNKYVINKSNWLKQATLESYNRYKSETEKNDDIRQQVYIEQKEKEELNNKIIEEQNKTKEETTAKLYYKSEFDKAVTIMEEYKKELAAIKNSRWWKLREKFKNNN